MKPAAATALLSFFVCLSLIKYTTSSETGEVIETSKDGFAVTSSRKKIDIFSFSPKSTPSESDVSASTKIKTIVDKNLEDVKSDATTNIRCIAEPADSKTSSDSNPIPAVQPAEKPKYAQAVTISGGKDSGPTLSILPLRLTLANIPEIAFLKRAPLTEAAATTITEEKKSDQTKQFLQLPDNLFIPIDIGISLKPTESKPTPEVKNLVSYQNAQSSEPKPSYSEKHLANKRGFRPFSKFTGYPKYPEQSPDANSYAPAYAFRDHESKSSERPYRSHYRPSSPSESRFYAEKAKVMASEDNEGCRTVIKEIKDVSGGRVKRGADEPRVIIMTKECFHPSDKAETIKIPAIKPGSYHKNFYHKSSIRPHTKHYDSTQNVPRYTNGQNIYHSPTRHNSYAYPDPYHYSSSSHFPHHHNYKAYPYYPSYYYGQRRSGNDDNKEEESSHHHDKHDHSEPRNEGRYHSSPSPKRDDSHKETHHHSSSDKVDRHDHDHHKHDDGHHGHHKHDGHHHRDHDHHDHDHHGHDHHHHHGDHDHHRGHHNHGRDGKSKPKTVTRSFAYYRKDKDNGKNPHSHEEGEEYAQGKYRSYSTSYDSDRDGPK